MPRYFAIALVCAGVIAAQDRPNRFSGEVSGKQEFRKDLGGGLVFVLSPDEDSGWTIIVAPTEHPNDPECDDYVAVATPPYHGENPRFINTSYGVKASEAVKNSRRQFSFVTNCADSHREEKWVKRVTNPGGFTDKEVKEGYAKLGSSPLGEGVLTILDSKISPARDTVEGVNLGQIDWMKFEVTIKLPKRN
jgi:hypothetical protein